MNSNTILPLEKIIEKKDFFSIIQIEKKIRSFKIYFDTYDVIDIIQGIWAFESYLKFNHTKFREDPSVLVHSFAFKGFYDQIYLLPPHQGEFANKILYGKMPQFSNLALDKYQEVEDEFLGILQLDKLLEELNNFDDELATKRYLEKLKSRSQELFKADLLLMKPFWKERLRYLLDEKKYLVLEKEDNYDSYKIIKTDTFRIIKEAFDEVRPTECFQKSNFVDALALYFLQQKLEKHLKNKSKEPLPIFYSSSKGIMSAFEVLQRKSKGLLEYKASNGQFVPIIRDSIYFVLHPIFRNEAGDKKLADLFSVNLEEKKREIEKIINIKLKDYEILKNVVLEKGKLEKKWLDFQNGVMDLISIEFIRNVWFEEKAHVSLHRSLQEFNNYRRHLKDFRGYVDKESARTIDQLRIDFGGANLLTKIFNSLGALRKDIRKYLNYRAGLDVYRDFGLTKFGIELSKCPRIQQTIQNLIIDLEVIGDRVNYEHQISEIVTFLISDPKEKQGINNLIVGLVVLWAFEKYHLIVEICNRIRPNYRRYELALIHASSLAMLQTKDARQIPAVIECVYSKNKDNYKVWIGKSYSFYRVWEKLRDDIPALPEWDAANVWGRIAKSSEYSKFYEVSIIFAKKSVDYLKVEKDKDPMKQDERRGHYCYILNNYIYYITKSGNRQEFKKLRPYYSEFRELIRFQDIWQGRFYDTLGWFNLRRAILEKNPEYLEIARGYNRKSFEKIRTPRDEGTYERLKELIPEVQAELFD